MKNHRNINLIIPYLYNTYKKREEQPKKKQKCYNDKDCNTKNNEATVTVNKAVERFEFSV